MKPSEGSKKGIYMHGDNGLNDHNVLTNHPVEVVYVM